MLVLCVVVLGLSDLLSKESSSIATEERVSVMIPIAFGLIGPFFYALRLFLVRKFAKQFGIEALHISTSGQAILEPVFLVTAIVLYTQGFYNQTDQILFLKGTLAGLFVGSGVVCLT